MASDSPHGTRVRYVSGCRCEPCRTAIREYMREYRKRKRDEAGLPPAKSYRALPKDARHRSFKIPENVYRAAAQKAAGEDESLSAVVRRLLEQYAG